MILGIDLGSRNVKIVVMDEERKIVLMKKYDTVRFYRENGKYVKGKLEVDFEKMEIDFNIDKVISTGYGRNNLVVNDGEKISELKAHAESAAKRTGLSNFTLLDIGGQDTKVIRVENGKMNDFYTNDKCAAGSGRYLENMSIILGISIEEMSKYSENPVEINNTCATFGESELIGKIIEGISIEDLCAGINNSVYKRAEPFIKKYPTDNLVFTGGVAKNNAIIEIIKKNIKSQLYIPEYPDFNGAIGCCLYGLDKNI